MGLDLFSDIFSNDLFELCIVLVNLFSAVIDECDEISCITYANYNSGAELRVL